MRKRTAELSVCGAEKGLLQGPARMPIIYMTPDFSKGFPKATLKAGEGKGMVSCCKLLVSDPFVLVTIQIGQVRSGCSWKPPARQMLFCFVTFYPYMNGFLKVRALRKGYPVYFTL